MRRLLWKTSVVVCAGLALVVVLMFATHVRARRAVTAYKVQLVAEGETLRIEDLVPAPLSRESNGVPEFEEAVRGLTNVMYDVGMQPTLMLCIAPGRARVSWQQATLSDRITANLWPLMDTNLPKAQAALAALPAALTKPHLQWSLDYRQPFGLNFRHQDSVQSCFRTLATAASWELHRSQPDAAHQHLQCQAMLLHRFEGEALLLCQLYRQGLVNLGMASVWEALQFQGWTDAQLADLQEHWAAIDLFQPLESALRMELAMTPLAYDHLRRSRMAYLSLVGSGGAPANTAEGFYLPTMLRAAFRHFHASSTGYLAWKWWGSYEEELLALRTWQAGLTAVRQARTEQKGQSALPQLRQRLSDLFRRPNGSSTIKLLPTPTYPNLLNNLGHAAAAESHRRLAVAALALERYRLRHGRYPGDLAALVPELLPEVPKDWMDGQPLRYRLQGTNAFLLYSIGEDGEDNGGDPAPADAADKPQIWNGRDWVWPKPASPEAVDAYFRNRK